MTYNLSTTMDFGQHEGKSMDELIVEEPDYIMWCIDNVEGFELDEEATTLLEESLRADRREHGRG